MSNTKSEQRFDDLSDFAVGEDFDGSGVPVGFRYPTSFSDESAPVNYKARFETAYGWAKKLFLFLPGTLFLYYTTIGLVLYTNEMAGWNHFLFWFAAGSFIVWLGLGEIKNLKHLAIPASIIAISLVVSGAVSFFPRTIRADFFLTYSMYFLPLVFVVPVMVKNLVDREPAS